ncbi:MAG: hypothetical protein U0S12_11410 [Fimbriimonadales bacterium]
MSLILLAVVAVQTASPVVDAERAFAADVAKRGIREGFLAAMDERSIVFFPAPTKGVEVYGNLPESKAKLVWEPEIAGISRDGTMGFTTGPYRLEIPGNAKPGAGYYFTVWAKKPEGWRLVFDAGAPCPAPEVKVFDVRTLATKGRSTGGKLAEAEKAWLETLDGDARTYSPKRAPALGREGAEAVVKDLKLSDFRTTKWGLAPSGDLAWSYGEMKAGDKPAYFARAWRYEGRWRLAVQTFSM